MGVKSSEGFRELTGQSQVPEDMESQGGDC